MILIDQSKLVSIDGLIYDICQYQ